MIVGTFPQRTLTARAYRAYATFFRLSRILSLIVDVALETADKVKSA